MHSAFCISPAIAQDTGYSVDIASGNISLTETEGIKYANGTAYEGAITITDSDTTVANVLTIESGEHNVTISSVTAHQIVINKNAKLNLTLTGDSMFDPDDHDFAAINVVSGAELVITESSLGSVTAKGGDGAGIGGNDNNNSGKITINGGTVKASGGYGAGIGGGYCRSGNDITITGGTVTASGSKGAGIGGGYSGDGINITITGGTVTATSNDGAGIGGGYNGSGSSGIGSNITISGGTVIARCYYWGAGIGGGRGGSLENVVITGGTITARGGNDRGPAMGSGTFGARSGIVVSPEEYCVLNVKETADAEEFIGKYSAQTDIAKTISDCKTIYMYFTSCGGNHVDEDGNHKCDICEMFIDGVHSDENNDHLCDLCDYAMSECEDTNPADHLCDICNEAISVCVDEDNDCICDICFDAFHHDETGDHLCDICNQVVSECDFDTNNGFCLICDKYQQPEFKDNCYQIENAGHLYWFANHINTVDRTANAVLLNDIDLEGKSDGTGRKWTPIGSTGENNNNFRGHFDGNNHTITNLYVDKQGAGLGLFGEVRLGTVENFTIYGDVKLFGDCSYVGGVIGSAPGANGTDVPDHNGAKIRNITSYVNVILEEGSHGSSYVGGFIGYANHETIIENCSWYGALDLDIYRADSGVGGLVGRLYDKSNVTIRNCAAYGTIKTAYKNGTHNNYDTIYIGGVLSYSPKYTQAVLENNLWAGNFIDDTDLGAKAHLSAFGTLNGDESVTNCYTINSVPYITTEDKYTDGITAVTPQRLASGEVAYLLQGKQTTEVWGQDLANDNSLPVLGGNKVYLSNGIYHNEVKEFEILSNGTNGSKANATVAIPTEGTYTLIFADYDGTILNNMDFVTVTAQSDNTVVIVPSKIDITLGTGDKIMLFSNMTNLIPKCKALVIK